MKEEGDKVERGGRENTHVNCPLCNTTLWPKAGIRGPPPPKLTTPLTKDTVCTEIMGGGWSTCVIDSTIPGVSVGGASKSVTAPTPLVATRNREDCEALPEELKEAD